MRASKNRTRYLVKWSVSPQPPEDFVLGCREASHWFPDFEISRAGQNKAIEGLQWLILNFAK